MLLCRGLLANHDGDRKVRLTSLQVGRGTRSPSFVRICAPRTVFPASRSLWELVSERLARPTSVEGLTMPEFIIYRHDRPGAGAEADRADPDKRPVARVQAKSAEDACRIASGQIALGADQHVSAEPADAADAPEVDRNRTSRGLERDTAPDHAG